MSFETDLKRGQWGERLARRYLPFRCWLCTDCTMNSHIEPNCRAQTWEDVTKDENMQKTQDIDFIVHFDREMCEQCAYLPDGAIIPETQRHEIKTCYATHANADRCIAPTQNIVVETVTNCLRFARDNTQGVGWWNKGERADWYHFVLPFTDVSDKRHFEAVNAELVERWKADSNVPNGSRMIERFPPDYAISITSKALEALIDENGYKLKTINGGNGRGYLIPVLDMIGGRAWKLSDNRQTVSADDLTHITGALKRPGVQFYPIWRYVRKGYGENGLTYIPASFFKSYGRLSPESVLYAPRPLRDALMRAVNATGAMPELRALKHYPMFKSKYRNAEEMPDVFDGALTYCRIYE